MSASEIVDQPPPVGNDSPAIQDLAIDDAHDTWPAPPPAGEIADDANTATEEP